MGRRSAIRNKVGIPGEDKTSGRSLAKVFRSILREKVSPQKGSQPPRRRSIYRNNVSLQGEGQGEMVNLQGECQHSGRKLAFRGNGSIHRERQSIETRSAFREKVSLQEEGQSTGRRSAFRDKVNFQGKSQPSGRKSASR